MRGAASFIEKGLLHYLTGRADSLRFGLFVQPIFVQFLQQAAVYIQMRSKDSLWLSTTI